MFFVSSFYLFYLFLYWSSLEFTVIVSFAFPIQVCSSKGLNLGLYRFLVLGETQIGSQTDTGPQNLCLSATVYHYSPLSIDLSNKTEK